MYKSFNSLDELFTYMYEDKHWTGANASHFDRYPIRFVLFDNFSDFNEFIVNRPDGIYKHSIDTMIDIESPDDFLSYTELSGEIRAFTKKIPINDFIIYPFSEMARFYDNEEYKEFDALITTIRGSQAPEDAQSEHVRIYIPIVGMQKKMGRFMNDNSTFVWEFKSETDKGTYNLVVTNGTTYGVSGLSDKYTYVKNLYEWLKLWEKGSKIQPTIISSSPNIFANAHFAKPDNAFTYTECKNAYEFLVKGLHLDFGVTEDPCEEEMCYWEQLAAEIDVNTFNFDEFVKERLDTFTLQDGIDFIKSWFDCETDFDRWLLSIYFRKIVDKTGYVYHAVSRCFNLSKSELFSNIATLIFEETNKEAFITERFKAMNFAAEKGVKITDMARAKLKAKLMSIAIAPEQGGYYFAAKLLTPLTEEELQLAIRWVAQGNINLNDVKSIFPGFYSYLQPLDLNSLEASNQWILEYFNNYRLSKISDNINERVSEIVSEKNANSTSFFNWYDNFKTVKTILHNRSDIDVFYWIDGLGVDWIPFVRSIIEKFSKERVYLNEIHIAVADLPTTTAANKPILQSLLPDDRQLEKIGNLDSFAHSSKNYPQYIIEEMNILEKAITQVLDKYTGKKIAFISDHGVTYLSQHSKGLKLAGLTPNHEGRLADIVGENYVSDNNYIILDDKKTICSLTHKSLTDKVNVGHGAHGGCSPEEVLVPIIVVSSQKNANTYSVAIDNDEIESRQPTLKFTIRGLASVDVPTLEYNGVIYHLLNLGNDKFESERLNLVDTATKAIVRINNEIFETFNIKISTGATEDDLFGDL